ncbi:MAG: 16S rRNA (guanine(966)-N(2))-methyltransferase RsmD [Xanthomonadaceae bacterium]|nr:16S rRNA (guanine(966)-N(2))-methyltransferase RsmD [Xanthomonadaceae bacterium]
MAGKIRIIGGTWRGRRLRVLDAAGLRPSGDRSRERLFNWLQGFTQGAHCLDLFAGTGALGLECASRGAASVTLVERDGAVARHIVDSIVSWPGSDAVTVHRAEALAWLRRPVGPFDLVFVDPPFDSDLVGPVLQALARPGLLAAGAQVYVESPAGAQAGLLHDAKPEPAGWAVRREKCVAGVRMQLLTLPGERPL